MEPTAAIRATAPAPGRWIRLRKRSKSQPQALTIAAGASPQPTRAPNHRIAPWPGSIPSTSDVNTDSAPDNPRVDATSPPSSTPSSHDPSASHDITDKIAAHAAASKPFMRRMPSISMRSTGSMQTTW